MKLKAYHISHVKNRESIQSFGLIPCGKKEGRIKYEPRIFFSINREDLGFDYVGYENVDCWEFEVDSVSIKQDLFSSCQNHFYIENCISSDKLKILSSH
jgi:hypothetical protein